MPKDSGKPRRSPGEGHVYEIRPGRHRAEAQYTANDGTARRVRVYGRTAREARDSLADELRKVRLGVTTAGPSLTVSAYLADWIERDRLHVKPSTWRGAESHVRTYWIPAIGRIPLVRLTAADVGRALASFVATGRPDRPAKRGRGRSNAGGIAPMTAQHIRGTLRRALAEAVREGLVARNAAADARPPRAERKPIVYLTTRDVTRLLDSTADSEYGPLYALAATTGLRLGELLGLSWGDVADGTLTVRRSMVVGKDGGWALDTPKTARSRRTIPLPIRARQALETQRTRQRFAARAAGEAWHNPDGLVFTDGTGAPMNRYGVDYRWPKDRDAAGVPKVRFHDLRHSAATALLTAGVPLVVVSEWLGHSGIAITASAYAAVVPELLTDAAEAMDRALGGAS